MFEIFCTVCSHFRRFCFSKSTTEQLVLINTVAPVITAYCVIGKNTTSTWRCLDFRKRADTMHTVRSLFVEFADLINTSLICAYFEKKLNTGSERSLWNASRKSRLMKKLAKKSTFCCTVRLNG